jgi:hypothetical protein
MEVPPVPASSSAADSDAAGQVSDAEPSGLSTPDSDAATRCVGDLPVRIALDRSLIRRQHRMDDPEVLEQVLTRLLNLP